MAHRILVIGPTSGLAEEFVLAAPRGWAFEGVGRRAALVSADRYDVVHFVDAQEMGPLEFAVRANDCDTVVSFLQEGNRQRCQEERPLPGDNPAGVAWEVNVAATEAIGRAAASEKKRVIVVSTDEVFPESGGPAPESAIPVPWTENPSWYGGTWAEAETLLERLAGSIAVLRVSALFGWTHDTECDRRLAAALSRSHPGAPEELQPTLVADAVRAIRLLVEEPLAGIFHVAVDRPIRREELAGAMRTSLGGRVAFQGPVPERHPGLVPHRLIEAGFRPTAIEVALSSLRPEVTG